MGVNKRTVKIFFCGALLLAFGFSFFAVAEEKRSKKVDVEMGGMEQGSRVPAPKGEVERKPGSQLPLSSPQAPANRIGAGPASMGQTAGRKTSAQEIPMEVTPGETDSTRDTIGEVEEKEVFKLDLEAEGIHSIGDAVSEQEIIPAKPEKPVTETTTETPAETSSAPIVGVDVNADLQSGQVETGATVDTSGELEERQIIDADVDVADTGSVGAEVGSAVDITESNVVEEANITTQPIETVVAQPADVSADVDTTGETIGGEADVGVEAEVSDTSESDEVACDPADSLLLNPSCEPSAIP